LTSGVGEAYRLDRNAYVWEPSPQGWKPTLVLLRINRAATCVRWSPSELKFAAGSGARCIAICHFEEEDNWWVSKQLKKPIRSTITSLSWHPNSVLLAAGSTDGHARVFSSFIKGIDDRPSASVWGERLPFNTVCGEYLNDTAGWVHDVAFSPSGNALAFVSHDSSLTVVYPSAPDQPPKAVVSVATQLLPFAGLVWSTESEIIAAGYVCVTSFRQQPNSSRTVRFTSSKAVSRDGSCLEVWKERVSQVSLMAEQSLLSTCSSRWISRAR
jgi:actin related protein 2/3 complex subunit 1A/1B